VAAARLQLVIAIIMSRKVDSYFSNHTVKHSPTKLYAKSDGNL